VILIALAKEKFAEELQNNDFGYDLFCSYMYFSLSEQQKQQNVL
jgi:hypothetical protein